MLLQAWLSLDRTHWERRAVKRKNKQLSVNHSLLAKSEVFLIAVVLELELVSSHKKTSGRAVPHLEGY